MAVIEDTVSYLMEMFEYALPHEETFESVDDGSADPCHVVRRMQYVTMSRLQNLLWWAMILILLPTTAMAASEDLPEDSFTTMVITVLSLVASACFLLGRWSKAALKEPTVLQACSMGTQTDDTTVSRKLREEIELWQLRTLEAQSSARESRKIPGLGHRQHELWW